MVASSRSKRLPMIVCTIVGGFVLAGLSILFGSGRYRSQPWRDVVTGQAETPFSSPSLARWRRMIEENFAGDQTCAECHRKEFEAHRRSGHSRTMTPMHASDWARQLVDDRVHDDPIRDQKFEYAMHGEQFFVRDVRNPQFPAVAVTWLLGSGIHAQTPVFVDEPSQRGVEFRWSYLANIDDVAMTPNHDDFMRFSEGSIECYGRPMDAADLRSCLGCHSTIGPPAELPLRDEFYVANVGCERCHGPRKRHVELAHLGQADAVKPLQTFESADAYMDVCSQCHRDATTVSKEALPHEVARFQPYGLKQSRCFTQSPAKLTCSTCHDPHDTTSHDRGMYIERCQRCHEPTQFAICPESPQGDCIDCHMPATEWTQGIEFHDHHIRVWPNRRALKTKPRGQVDGS